jgi:hypothetical protein
MDQCQTERMDDRRRPPARKRTFKSGTIAFNRAGGITGVVKNVSDTGAMIEVESVVGIPDEFTLVIEVDHFKRPCRVIWRQPTRIGVQFL